MNMFLKNQHGVFSVITAIVLLPLLLLTSAALTTGTATLKRNDAQNAADLAVISAAASYFNKIVSGMPEQQASNESKEVNTRVFATNLRESLQNSQKTFSGNGSGEFSVTFAGTTEELFNVLDTQNIRLQVAAKVNGNYTPGTSSSAQETFEIIYIYDASGSMLRSFNSPLSSADQLRISAKKGYDTLFSGLTTLDLNNIEVSQLVFNDDVTFIGEYTSEKTKLVNDFNKEYVTAKGTNLRGAVEDAIESLENNNFQRPGRKNNQIIVLMSDGAPSSKRVPKAGGGYTVVSARSFPERKKEVNRMVQACKKFRKTEGNIVISLFFETYEQNNISKLGADGLKDCSNGGFYNVDNQQDLTKSYEDIAKRIKLAVQNTNFNYTPIRISK